MTSRTPAESTPEHDRGPGEPDPARATGITEETAQDASVPDTATDAPAPKPGDLGEQAPAVEPTRPNWSRLAGADADAAAADEPQAEASVQVTRRRVPLWLVLVLALAGFAADQGSKFWAMSALDPGSYRPLIGEVLGFQLVFNSGAAFSLAEGMTWVFTIVAAVVAVVIVRVARNLRSRAWALVLAGLLGGTLGNLFDRLFREPGFGRGYVVDFINYNGYFVGNVADIFIVAAAIGMGVLTFIGIGFDGRRAGQPIEDDDASTAGEVASPSDIASPGDISDGPGPSKDSDGADETIDTADVTPDEEPTATPASPAEPRG